jgi:hypothetical protein
MPEFDEVVNKQAYELHSLKKQQYVDDIENIVLDTKCPLEGNLMYLHQSRTTHADLVAKQQNVFWCGTQARTRICEIGFNAGHSSMFLLLGRDQTPLEFTVFDIGHHPYTKPCLQYIQSTFPHVNVTYVEGDSTKTMPKWIEANPTCLGIYDVIHVDGGHSEHCITNDMKHADLLVRKDGIVIIDDTHMAHINACVNVYLSCGKYREMDILQTERYRHRMLQKIL